MLVLKEQNKATRMCYSAGFKAEALSLAEGVGVAGAAKKLRLH